LLSLKREVAESRARRDHAAKVGSDLLKNFEGDDFFEEKP
jgi:hypothetical protein